MLQGKVGARNKMSNRSVVSFDANALAKEIMDKMVNRQTDLLISYAMNEIIRIGDKIASRTSANNMDRTGNLLDSLCWGVAYRGELKGSGFYRLQKATIASSLHEWFRAETRSKYDPYGNKGLPWEKLGLEELPPVWGHDMAEHYLTTYGKKWSEKGWRVFFAICAPYWGFWERGFTLRRFGGSSSFIQFAVMSQFYDEIKADLKPARTKLHVTNVSYTNTQLAKQAKRGLYKGYKRKAK